MVQVNELQGKFVRWSDYKPSNALKSKTGDDLERGSNSILWQAGLKIFDSGS